MEEINTFEMPNNSEIRNAATKDMMTGVNSGVQSFINGVRWMENKLKEQHFIINKL